MSEVCYKKLDKILLIVLAAQNFYLILRDNIPRSTEMGTQWNYLKLRQHCGELASLSVLQTKVALLRNFKNRN